MEVNYYLQIDTIDKKYLRVSSYDIAFISTVTLLQQDFADYCDNQAKDWLESNLGNYDDWDKKDRELIANKWKKAKYLTPGRYNYYFNNTDDIKNIFREAIEELATTMGINNFTLIV